MQYTINIIVEGRIDYDLKDYDQFKKIEDFSFNLCKELDLHWKNTGKGPAWNAYIVITGNVKQREDIQETCKKIVRYIKRFKDHKLY